MVLEAGLICELVRVGLWNRARYMVLHQLKCEDNIGMWIGSGQALDPMRYCLPDRVCGLLAITIVQRKKRVYFDVSYFEQFFLYFSESHLCGFVNFILNCIDVRCKFGSFLFVTNVFKCVRNIFWSLIKNFCEYFGKVIVSTKESCPMSDKSKNVTVLTRRFHTS